MVVKCDTCGKKNRVPTSKLHRKGKCGKCTERLGPRRTPISVASVSEFDDFVENAEVPILIDFWAPWCGPCKMAAPHVDKTAQARAGKALVLKVNTDDMPTLGKRYNVRGIPNFVVLKDGEVVHQKPGMVPAPMMAQWIDQAREA